MFECVPAEALCNQAGVFDGALAFPGGFQLVYRRLPLVNPQISDFELMQLGQGIPGGFIRFLRVVRQFCVEMYFFLPSLPGIRQCLV